MTGAATFHQAGAVLDPERRRLAEARDSGAPWLQWGPYLSGSPVGYGSRGLLAERHGVG
jgi:hypothetical protein